MKEKRNTKEIIIEKSMKLFSINGFHAVTIRQIADEVGIGNSALYKHFSSKQEIFDVIVERSKERYITKCKTVVNSEIRGVEQVKEICIQMFRYQTEDEWIVMFRRLLVMEQFRNEKMARIYREFFIDIPLQSQKAIFEFLIEKGLMRKKNPVVLSMELYAPFFMYHTVKEQAQDLIKLFEEHVEYFFENYVTVESIGEENNNGKASNSK